MARRGEPVQRISHVALAVVLFVVAGNVHEGVPEFLELALPRREPLVGAGPLAAGDVADVDDESEILAVDLLDHRVERRRLGLAVRRIADQREGDGGMKSRRQQRRNVRRAAGEGEKQGEAQTSQERRSWADPPGRGCCFFVTRKRFVMHNFDVVFRRKRSNKPIERIGSLPGTVWRRSFRSWLRPWKATSV